LLHRPCAIKLIRPELACDPNAVDRFEREVELTAACAVMLDRDRVRLLMGPAAGVKVVLFLMVLLERTIGVVPRSEVVDATANLLGPIAGGVGVQGLVGIRLGWLTRLVCLGWQRG
jgi:hypothetical protein